jgi:hypothetical protein
METNKSTKSYLLSISLARTSVDPASTCKVHIGAESDVEKEAAYRNLVEKRKELATRGGGLR